VKTVGKDTEKGKRLSSWGRRSVEGVKKKREGERGAPEMKRPEGKGLGRWGAHKEKLNFIKEGRQKRRGEGRLTKRGWGVKFRQCMYL